jgi:peptide/nickel transport system substrate-binding protein/oligopeptide transport system substrate-binding protein
MQVRRITAAGTALLTAVAAALSGCTGPGDDGGDDRDGMVSIEIAEPRHLVPTNTDDADGLQVLGALFAPLVDFDAQHRPRQVAAESIDSPDSRVWTIRLKDGYTFHNGEKVTADNYIDAWNYGAYAPNAQRNSYLFSRIAGYADVQSQQPRAKTLAGLRKVDDLAFTVTLSQPFSEFRAVLGHVAFLPLPAAAWQSEGVLKTGFEDAPIGNGPFRMDGTWQRGTGIDVVRYDAYAGGRPAMQGARFRIYRDPGAAYADVVAGTLDVIRAVPAEKLATAASDLGQRVQRSPGALFQFLVFPAFDTQFAEPAVRRAISRAIDRDGIARSVFGDAQLPVRSFVPPVVAGHRADTCGAACAFDPVKARQEYTAAGGPAVLRLSYNSDGAHKEWIDATCAQLSTNLGVQCVAAAEPTFADLLAKVERKQPVGLFRMAWTMDYPSLESYLGPLYGTGGSANYSGYRNPEFDTRLKEGAAAPSADRAVRAYQQAEDVLARDMPVIPLRFAQNTFGHSTRVRNVVVDPFGRVDLVRIELVG